MTRDLSLVIGAADPRAADVRALVETHLGFAHATTPICYVYALPVDGLADPDVSLFGAWRDGTLLAVGALRRIDERHAEIKSMHTAEGSRGSGVGGAMLDHLVATARAAGYERLSLETGTQEAFTPARRLYTRAGFTRCPPFGGYTDNEHSVCMTMLL